jgi:carbamate kinase
MVLKARVVREKKRGYRKVVASPEPVELLPRGAAASLLAEGFIVNAGGGGGIPVRRMIDGNLEGVEAVIDKDRTAVLLAREVAATDLVFLTEVPCAYLHYGTEKETPLRTTHLEDLRRHIADRHFAEGSMGPKMRASLDFVESGGRRALVTDLSHLEAALAGEAGTQIIP